MNIEALLNEFIHYAETEGLFIEGIAAADENRVFFEHHFRPDLARNIYSHTKSYTATGAGIAVDKGLLSLDDKLADFFPECVPDGADPRIADIKLRHLLTMSSGFGEAYLMNKNRRAGTGAPDYLSYMMSREIKVDPGTAFHYSSADSILVVRMVEKATGLPFGQFMFENVFTKMDLGWPMWEFDPQGHPNGGGGMCLKLTNMMRIGQVYLADGLYRGERVVSADWVRKASSTQIDNTTEDIWTCGYGYQFWMLPYPKAYRADGAFGQISAVLPEAGIVVAIQCPEYGKFEDVKNALHEIVLSRV